MMKKVFYCGVLSVLCILSLPGEARSHTSQPGIIVKLFDSFYTVHLEKMDETGSVSYINFQVRIPHKVRTFPEYLQAIASFHKSEDILSYRGFGTLEGEIQPALPCMKN